MYCCDLCKKDATPDHKIVCERCYNLLLHLLTAFESKKQTKSLKKPSKKKEKRAPKKGEIPKPEGKKTARELQFEKAASGKLDPADLLTKCATCELSFLNKETKKIECVDGKDPRTCGKFEG